MTDTDDAARVIPLSKILVADRYRKDLGDVSELAASIVEIGLLNPITVTEYHGGYRLVAGERRLTAFQALNLTEIPARIARNIIEARDLLVAERDENTQRKEMLPSEAAALGMAIEEMERPAALARQQASVKHAADVRWGNASGSREPDAYKEVRARTVAAEAVGMSEATFTRVKTAILTADDESQPAEVRQVARDVIRRIDAGEPIRAQVERIKEARETPAVAQPKVRANDPTDYLARLARKYPTFRIAHESEGYERYASPQSLEQAARNAGVKWQFNEKQWIARTAKSQERLDRASLSIEAAVSALEVVDFSTITTEQAQEALQRIDRNRLNQYIRKLKEIGNV
jgi:ParB family chromosome partitioning protein